MNLSDLSTEKRNMCIETKSGDLRIWKKCSNQALEIIHWNFFKQY